MVLEFNEIMNNKLAMMLLADVKLPAIKFFKPNKRFITYMIRQFPYQQIYDVGAGVGHVTKVLKENGCHYITALDFLQREEYETHIELGDGTTYPYQTDSVVMLCRPCHGHFVSGVIANALYYNAAIALYVGLTKNVEEDLYDYKHFKLVAKNVGEEGENIWRYDLPKGN